MNIAYVINARIPTEKAHGVQIMKMCEAFAKGLKSHGGGDVELVINTRLAPSNDETFKFYGIPSIFRLRRVWSLDLVSFGKVGLAIQTITFGLFAAISLARSKVDLIYSRDEYASYFLSLFGRPVVFELHSTNKPRFFLGRTLRTARLVVVITSGLRDFVMKEYGIPSEKIVVLHDGVDMAEYDAVATLPELRTRFGLPLDRFIVAFVGKYRTMGRAKGVTELIDAVASLIPTHPDLFLLLVGIDGGDVSLAKEAIAASGIPKDAYLIVGHLPHAIALQHMQAADTLVMNYPNEPHYAHFMSPLKLFEYMGAGRAIIASDLPAVREVLAEDETYYSDPDKDCALADSIVEVLRDPTEGARRGEAAKRKVLHYTWESRIEKILEAVGK